MSTAHAQPTQAELLALVAQLQAQLAQKSQSQPRVGFIPTSTGKLMFAFPKRAGEKSRWPITLEGYQWQELVNAIKHGDFEAACEKYKGQIKG